MFVSLNKDCTIAGFARSIWPNRPVWHISGKKLEAGKIILEFRADRGGGFVGERTYKWVSDLDNYQKLGWWKAEHSNDSVLFSEFELDFKPDIDSAHWEIVENRSISGLNWWAAPSIYDKVLGIYLPPQPSAQELFATELSVFSKANRRYTTVPPPSPAEQREASIRRCEAMGFPRDACEPFEPKGLDYSYKEFEQPLTCADVDNLMKGRISESKKWTADYLSTVNGVTKSKIYSHSSKGLVLAEDLWWRATIAFKLGYIASETGDGRFGGRHCIGVSVTIGDIEFCPGPADDDPYVKIRDCWERRRGDRSYIDDLETRIRAELN
jgi:hypothetical protein